VRVKGEEIDIRVSTMPTVYGESVSLRLLMRNAALLGLSNLGLNERDEKLLGKIIKKPYGIVLVTGPTGSGKSTSLYAYLNTINSVDKRIITSEDPIEYEMAGVNQVHMKPEIGLTFASTLRAILRQDPDVIMVGEIRDGETAEIAIQAALTGHLVFSTLHTNDAASGFTRLLDMGIEPFLVASSIEALIAQRLVRRLCKECRTPANVTDEFLEEVAFPKERLNEGTIYEPAGCEACRGTGYSGRTGIYEVLIVNDAIRPMIIAHDSASAIKNKAIELGMHTLREDGWSKVLQGVTTIEEVLRVSEEDEDGLA
jgi:type II secretory ATPase GspE/PulE/Tfp pilus assembly ATPase PilB-like protein